MSMAYANVLSSTANAALNTYISPRYSKLANRHRAPAQPAAPAFGIWFPIFAGQIAYGFLSEDERSDEASMWNHAIQAMGLTYAWTLVSQRFYSMQISMLAMLGANAMYRRALPESTSLPARAVKFSAELGVGWLAAANLVVAAQNIRRGVGHSLSSSVQTGVGAAEAVALTGAAVAANRTLGWSGVSVAAAWALGGIAVDQKTKPEVRALAGVAAVGVLADLALKVFSDSRAALEASSALGDESIENSAAESADNYAVIVEETFVPPNMIIEEVSTVRI